MDAETWSDLVDLGRLAAWMDEQGIERGSIQDVALLSGGTQNILLRFRRGATSFVLRRPPRHPRMNGSETMRREARVLAALAPTAVPHPRLLAACYDEAVLGVAFYLMEQIEGFNITIRMPALHASNPAFRRDMGFALADGAAALGRIDYRAAGLEGFGKVHGFLERQVARWRSQLEGYAEYAGWPGPGEIPGIDKVAHWLEDNRPQSFVPGIVHGDYHLGNVLFRHDGPALAAIVDWELSTVGDPLIDLGWLMATWPEADGSRPGSPTVVRPWVGFPTANELAARYAQGTSRNLAALSWYSVLACFKLGIILEGSYARACAGKASKEVGYRLHATTIGLFERALKWI